MVYRDVLQMSASQARRQAVERSVPYYKIVDPRNGSSTISCPAYAHDSTSSPRETETRGFGYSIMTGGYENVWGDSTKRIGGAASTRKLQSHV